MKKLIIIALISVFSMAEAVETPKGENLKVCEAYIKQAQTFKKTMGDDEISKNTLSFYKEKMFVHCGSIVSKGKFEKKSFLKMMAKNEKTTTAECKMAIDIAANYSKNETQSDMIISAHKENIVDNCGTIVASHVSSYCIYDEAK